MYLLLICHLWNFFAKFHHLISVRRLIQWFLSSYSQIRLYRPLSKYLLHPFRVVNRSSFHPVNLPPLTLGFLLRHLFKPMLRLHQQHSFHTPTLTLFNSNFLKASRLLFHHNRISFSLIHPLQTSTSRPLNRGIKPEIYHGLYSRWLIQQKVYHTPSWGRSLFKLELWRHRCQMPLNAERAFLQIQNRARHHLWNTNHRGISLHIGNQLPIAKEKSTTIMP